MTSAEETNEELPTIAEDLVVTKYKMSAEIVNKVLKEMVAECKAGCSIRDLCVLGDKKLTEETGKVFKKDKKIAKGNMGSLPLRKLPLTDENYSSVIQIIINWPNLY